MCRSCLALQLGVVAFLAAAGFTAARRLPAQAHAAAPNVRGRGGRTSTAQSLAAAAAAGSKANVIHMVFDDFRPDLPMCAAHAPARRLL